MIFALLVLLGNLNGSSYEDEQQKDYDRLENLKNMEGEFESDKGGIFSRLRFWKSKEDIEKDKQGDNQTTVSVDTAEGKMEFKVDIDRRHIDEHIDRHYTMQHFREAINDIHLMLAPIISVETFYTLNRSGLAGEDETIRRELIKKVWWMVHQMYRNEDDLKKNVTILLSNADFIKRPNFKLGEFYFDNRFEKTEELVYYIKDERVKQINLEYLGVRDKVVAKASEIEDITHLLNEALDEFYQVHNQILMIYNEEIKKASQMNEISPEVLAHLEHLFKERAKIIDLTQMLLREALTFRDHKDELMKIFERADFVVKGVDLKLQADDFNDEQYFDKHKEESDARGIENSVRHKLETGEIEMSDIKDVNLANNILKGGIEFETKKSVSLTKALLSCSLLLAVAFNY
jgi:hypothetical protein